MVPKIANFEIKLALKRLKSNLLSRFSVILYCHLMFNIILHGYTTCLHEYTTYLHGCKTYLHVGIFRKSSRLDIYKVSVY